MKQFKRFLCLILALAMFAGYLPEFAVKTEAAVLAENEIIEQIKNTYSSLSGKPFNGYCGAFVAKELQSLGVTKKAQQQNGKDMYDQFKNADKTDTGYYIEAYAAQNPVSQSNTENNIKNVLNTLTNDGKNNVYNVMLGFQATNTKNGKKYGHVLLIHAVINGRVLWSESFSGGLVSSFKFSEGEPINQPIDTFAEYYGKWSTFEGAIHFYTCKHLWNASGDCINNCGTNYYNTREFSKTISAENGTIICEKSATVELHEHPYNSSKLIAKYSPSFWGLVGTKHTFQTLEKCTNHLGEIWYKVSFENNSFAYIKCNRTEQNKVSSEPYYIPGAPNVIFSDIYGKTWIYDKKKGSMVLGEQVRVEGIVKAVNGNLSSVSVGIYDSAGKATKYTFQKDNINKSEYDIVEANNVIMFSKLTDPGTYSFRVTATVNGQTFTERKDFVVTAKNTPLPSYTVNFNSNNGSDAVQSRTVKSGASISLNELQAVYYHAHNFLGWSTSPSATQPEYTSASTLIPKNNMTLYAVWQAILPPSVPSLTAKSAEIGAGKAASVSWWSVAGAETYTVSFCKASGEQINSVTTYGMDASVVLKDPGTYTVKVKASNVAGDSGWSQAATITVHAPAAVVFNDYNGREWARQTVSYGENAVTPNSPTRTGYTFTGWSGSLTNVKEDRTITAQYTPIAYTVTFLDCNGEVASRQQVTYNGDVPGAAVPPADSALNMPEGYVRIGWNTDEWESVTRDGIVVSPCITWERTTLPITAQISNVTAYGADVNTPDGYSVAYTLTNHVASGKSGRLVVAMKTPSGKFVANTESGAIYIGAGQNVSGTIFIPFDEYDKGNNGDDIFTVELYVVDRFASMTPLSPMVSTHVLTEKNSEWGAWMTAEQYANYSGNGDKSQYQTKVEYRYQTRSITDWTTGSAPSGWSLLQSRTSISPWSSWSGWQTSPAYSSDTVLVETRDIANYATEYRYGRYLKSAGGYHFADNVVSVKSSTPDYSAWSRTKVNPDRTNGYYYSSNNNSAGTGRWDGSKYIWDGYLVNGSRYYWEETRSVVASYTKEYRYATRYYYNEYQYYRFSDWSDWSTTAVMSNADRNVQTRTLYRVKEPTVTIPDVGYAVSGTVSNLENPNGRQAILTVFKVDSASDYTNEYVGQTTLDANGHYDFGKIMTFEDPSAATGDFTATLTIEGCSGVLFIDTGDTFKVPRKSYTVEFMDGAERVGEPITVLDGDTVMAPEMTEKEGYYFLGWDTGLANVRSDLVINAVYVPKTYTVVFVDNLRGTVAMKNDIAYGTGVEIEDPEAPEGYIFSRWAAEEEFNLNFVTGNAIVTAQYDKKVYPVQFLNEDGSVLNEQDVPYGESAEVPDEDTVETPDGQYFTGWNTDEYQFVSFPMTVTPVYAFYQAAPAAALSLESGIYSGAQMVELSAEEGTSVTYSLVTASEEELTEVDYTEPIEITESSVLYVTSYMENAESTTEAYEYIIVSPESVPAMPEAVNAEADEQAIHLSWNAAEKADGYIIDKTDLLGNTEKFVITGNSYDDENVHEQMEYTYSVTSYREVSNETASTMVMASGEAPSVSVKFYGEQYAVTGIAIQAPETVWNNGSVQLKADITPVNAYNQEVTWLVENGTGSAVVSENGILTGVSAGTVTVKAYAMDGSGVEASCVITVAEPVSGMTAMKVSSACARKGENVTVSVSIDPNSKAEMMQFVLLYDSNVLTFVSAEAGEAMETKSPTINGVIPGKVYFNWDATEALTDGGSLVNITFATADEQALQTLLTIETESDEDEFILMGYDTSGNPVDIGCTVMNGKVDIIDVLFGDVNNDGKINVVDANMIRRHAAQLTTLTESQLLGADVNGDGKVNVVDANLIRRYAAKIIDSFT